MLDESTGGKKHRLKWSATVHLHTPWCDLNSGERKEDELMRSEVKVADDPLILEESTQGLLKTLLKLISFPSKACGENPQM